MAHNMRFSAFLLQMIKVLSFLNIYVCHTSLTIYHLLFTQCMFNQAAINNQAVVNNPPRNVMFGSGLLGGPPRGIQGGDRRPSPCLAQVRIEDHLAQEQPAEYRIANVQKKMARVWTGVDSTQALR